MYALLLVFSCYKCTALTLNRLSSPFNTHNYYQQSNYTGDKSAVYAQQGQYYSEAQMAKESYGAKIGDNLHIKRGEISKQMDFNDTDNAKPPIGLQKRVEFDLKSNRMYDSAVHNSISTDNENNDVIESENKLTLAEIPTHSVDDDSQGHSYFPRVVLNAQKSDGNSEKTKKESVRNHTSTINEPSKTRKLTLQNLTKKKTFWYYLKPNQRVFLTDRIHVDLEYAKMRLKCIRDIESIIVLFYKGNPLEYFVSFRYNLKVMMREIKIDLLNLNQNYTGIQLIVICNNISEEKEKNMIRIENITSSEEVCIEKVPVSRVKIENLHEILYHYDSKEDLDMALRPIQYSEYRNLTKQNSAGKSSAQFPFKETSTIKTNLLNEHNGIKENDNYLNQNNKVHPENTLSESDTGQCGMFDVRKIKNIEGGGKFVTNHLERKTATNKVADIVFNLELLNNKDLPEQVISVTKSEY